MRWLILFLLIPGLAFTWPSPGALPLRVMPTTALPVGALPDYGTAEPPVTSGVPQSAGITPQFITIFSLVVGHWAAAALLAILVLHMALGLAVHASIAARNIKDHWRQ